MLSSSEPVPNIVLDHVCKTYPNGVQAVRDLNLAVAAGELVVIVGPSGSGKTSILRLIAGLEDLTGGTITIGGRIVNGLPPRKRDVAMVFQRSTLYPHWTVRRNIAASLELRKSPWSVAARRWWPGSRRQSQRQQESLDEQIGRTARLLGVEELLDRWPGQLSGGERQRVALGRAIVRRPSVFLLDEPLSHLDGVQRADLRRELHLLQRRLRATMVYVTHDQIEAMTLADQLVVIDQGVVQQVGQPMAIYQRPRNRFVAGFVGWPAMSFIGGRIILETGQACFTAGDRALPLQQDRFDRGVFRENKKVTLGIRPEHVRIGGTGTDGTSLEMEVVLVEPLGREWLVTLQCDGWQVTTRTVEGQGIKSRQTVKVGFAMEHAHLFDVATGLALSQGPAG